jgi:hypothetical protein
VNSPVAPRDASANIFQCSAHRREMCHAHRRGPGLQRPRSGHACPRVPRSQGDHWSVSSVNDCRRQRKDCSPGLDGRKCFGIGCLCVYDNNETRSSLLTSFSSCCA